MSGLFDMDPRRRRAADTRTATKIPNELWYSFNGHIKLPAAHPSEPPSVSLSPLAGANLAYGSYCSSDAVRSPTLLHRRYASASTLPPLCRPVAHSRPPLALPRSRTFSSHPLSTRIPPHPVPLIRRHSGWGTVRQGTT